MNEKEQAKANLNRQLERDGGLQRAGMRKCVRVTIADTGGTYESYLDEVLKKGWKVEKKESDSYFLVSKDSFYFHGFYGEYAVLENEDGTLIRSDIGGVRFIT